MAILRDRAPSLADVHPFVVGNHPANVEARRSRNVRYVVSRNSLADVAQHLVRNALHPFGDIGCCDLLASLLADEDDLVSDPHSPAIYRVNGTIRNIEGWYSAFDIKPGDKNYVAPEERVRIW